MKVSLHNTYLHKIIKIIYFQVPNSTTVYRADMITYADLDPKAFMVPANKVLPSTMNGAFSDSSSKSTYAEISMSRSKLV